MLRTSSRHRRSLPRTELSPTEGGTALTAGLTGAAEAPGPGDTDGSGSATIRLRAGQGQICFQLTVQNVTLPAAAAHIHEGAAGVPGPVVVTLTAPDATGMSSGCVTVPRPLVADILANPAGYYVNVHTTDFQDGAVRASLRSPERSQAFDVVGGRACSPPNANGRR